MNVSPSDMGALSGSREPSPDGLGPTGFDPARSEVENLRETLRLVIHHCGGATAQSISSEFLCLAAEEVRLALVAAERRGFLKGTNYMERAA